jgi:hypothetical protein
MTRIEALSAFNKAVNEGALSARGNKMVTPEEADAIVADLVVDGVTSEEMVAVSEMTARVTHLDVPATDFHVFAGYDAEDVFIGMLCNYETSFPAGYAMSDRYLCGE